MEAALGPIGLALSAGSQIASGIAQSQQQRAMRDQERINAEWGKIRADQSDTAARVGIEDDISAARAAFSANDAGMNTGTLGVLQEIRRVRGRDRRIETGNMNRQANDATRRANSYRPGLAMLGGFMRAGPSLFELGGEMRGR